MALLRLDSALTISLLLCCRCGPQLPADDGEESDSSESDGSDDAVADESGGSDDGPTGADETPGEESYGDEEGDNAESAGEDGDESGDDADGTTGDDDTGDHDTGGDDLDDTSDEGGDDSEPCTRRTGLFLYDVDSGMLQEQRSLEFAEDSAVITPFAAGDFDGDGKTDVVARNADLKWQIHFGPFSAASVPIPADEVAAPPLATDLDGDGSDELVLVHLFQGEDSSHGSTFGSSLGLIHVTMDRQFEVISLPPETADHPMVMQIAAGDVTGDDLVDIVAVEPRYVLDWPEVAQGLMVLPGDGGLGFSSPRFIPHQRPSPALGMSSNGLALAQIDDTPGLDVVTLHHEWLPNDMANSLLLTWSGLDSELVPGPVDTQVTPTDGGTFADFDGDGKIDVILWGSWNISIARGDVGGSFKPAEIVLDDLPVLFANNAQLVAGDVDESGGLDFVIGGADLGIGLGAGDGTFELIEGSSVSPELLPTYSYPMLLDIDDSGDQEVLVSTQWCEA